MSDHTEMISYLELIPTDPHEGPIEMLVDTTHELDVGDALIASDERKFVVAKLDYRWLNDRTLVEFVRAREAQAP